MILGINRNGELHVFTSITDVEQALEAIDVKEDLFEFCDGNGQTYLPVFIRAPNVTKLIGPLFKISLNWTLCRSELLTI